MVLCAGPRALRSLEGIRRKKKKKKKSRGELDFVVQRAPLCSEVYAERAAYRKVVKDLSTSFFSKRSLVRLVRTLRPFRQRRAHWIAMRAAAAAATAAAAAAMVAVAAAFRAVSPESPRRGARALAPWPRSGRRGVWALRWTGADGAGRFIS